MGRAAVRRRASAAVAVGVHRLKDERYDHTRHMVELAAPSKVDTAPEKTIEAVADHGVISGNTIAGLVVWCGGQGLYLLLVEPVVNVNRRTTDL